MGAYKTIGEIAYGLGESAVKGIANWGKSPAFEASGRRVIDKAFGLNSTLTGKSGEYARRLLSEYDQKIDYHLANAVKVANAQGAVVPRHVLEGQARKMARTQVFGANDEILAGVTQAMRNEHGDIKAANFVDNMGVKFHEEARQGVAGGFGTRTTRNLSKNMLTEDLELNTPTYKARKPGFESIAHSWGSAALAFKAGLAHLSTPLNGLIGNSLESFGKSSKYFFGDNFEHAKAEIQSYNALGSIWADELGQMYNFRNGLINKYAPGSFGEFIHQNLSIPGFTALRQRTATMFAMQGKFSAMEYAEDLMSKDLDKALRAEKDLAWLGLDAKRIKANGGQLTKDDIRQAMYENTNQKMFLDQGKNRSYYGQNSPLGRLTTMYHGYGAAQANFIQKELYRQVVINKDPVAAAKTMAILGLVFPAVGTVIEGTKQVWSHPGKTEEHIANTEEILAKLGTSPALLERLSGISDVAGFGVLSSFTRAAGRRKLLESLAGPVINASVEGVQDIAKPTMDIIHGKKSDFKPLARDVLHDIPYLGVGSWVADKLLPSKADVLAKRPMTSRRLAAREAAARKKLKNR